MSNESSSTQRGTAGQTRRATPQARKPDDSRGLDATTMVFIGLVLAVIAGSAFIVMNNQSGGDTGATQERSASVEIEGDSLQRFDSGSMTPDTDPARGATAPVVTGENFHGDEVTLPVEGESTIITFLAHWCPHCQAELPVLLDEWINADVPEGVNITAVATAVDENRPNFPPSSWLLNTQDPWTAPILADTATNEVAAAYGLGGYPYFLVLGPDREVLARTTGELGRDQLQALVDLAQGAGNVGDVGQSGEVTQEGAE